MTLVPPQVRLPPKLQGRKPLLHQENPPRTRPQPCIFHPQTQVSSLPSQNLPSLTRRRQPPATSTRPPLLPLPKNHLSPLLPTPPVLASPPTCSPSISGIWVERRLLRAQPDRHLIWIPKRPQSTFPPMSSRSALPPLLPTPNPSELQGPRHPRRSTPFPGQSNSSLARCIKKDPKHRSVWVDKRLLQGQQSQPRIWIPKSSATTSMVPPTTATPTPVTPLVKSQTSSRRIHIPSPAPPFPPQPESPTSSRSPPLRPLHPIRQTPFPQEATDPSPPTTSSALSYGNSLHPHNPSNSLTILDHLPFHKFLLSWRSLANSLTS